MSESSSYSIEREIASLREAVRRHEKLYYVLDKPEISDAEYDHLIQKLTILETKYPSLITLDSPTQRVGGSPRDGFVKAAHDFPMLSLDNAFDESGLRDFDRRMQEFSGFKLIDYVGELKLDGISMSVKFSNGIMTRALTRGDGSTGEDVTANARTIRSLPLFIEDTDHFPSQFEVRGEVVMGHRAFETLNAERLQNSESTFVNPRNAAAGSLRILDPKITASRQLDFFAYMVPIANTSTFTHQWQILKLLATMGFKVNPHRKRLRGVDEILVFFEDWQKKRDRLSYDIDGLVIKVDSVAQQNSAGTTSKAPRWAIACKFAAEQTTTVVEAIDVQIGRTGAITPRAILKPVFVGGAKVSRTTLHNEDEITRLGLHIGDSVLIERSGDVIPKIVRVVEKAAIQQQFQMPTHCPACQTPLVREKNEAILRCVNTNCSARLKESILHFSSRSAMDIGGMGEALVNQLVEKKLVCSIADLYTIRTETLVQLQRFGSKSATNIIENIERSRKVPFARVIFSLGIRFVGERTAKILADNFLSISRISAMSFEELQQADDIGPRVAESILTFFGEPKNQTLIEQLKSAGLKLAKETSEESEDNLKGLNFVFTGTLTTMSRSKARELIAQRGGTTTSSISTKTDYVVSGTTPGSKLLQAKKIGTPVITETKFLQLVGINYVLPE